MNSLMPFARNLNPCRALWRRHAIAVETDGDPDSAAAGVRLAPAIGRLVPRPLAPRRYCDTIAHRVRTR